MSLTKKLEHYFGFSSFREKQIRIVKGALKNYDQLVILPTGSGKSICYQLPALIQGGITIVISPLKSLIKDQINNLQKKNINAVGYYGDVGEKKKDEILSEMLKENPKFNLIYTTPETLDNNIQFALNLRNIMENKTLKRFVIDEAHCVSLWGNDFRNSYRKLSNLKNHFPDTPIMALTATATPQVRKDIVHQLNFKKYHLYTKSYYRSNLKIKIFKRDKNYYSYLLNIVKEQFTDSTGIIYCLSRKKCDKLAEKLQIDGVNAQSYHAGLTTKNRINIENNWKTDVTRIIVATIAFGMGIDKKDVRFVIHNNLPTSLENYYQEIGRGGRDDEPCYCIMFYSYQDKIIQEKMIRENSFKSKNTKYIEHQLDKLNAMINFCEDKTECRHCRVSNYLGETRCFEKDRCVSSCDNCINSGNLEKEDVTIIAKDILNLIIQLGSSPYKSTLLDSLRYLQNYSNYKLKYGTVAKLKEMFNRVLIYMIINKYIEESLVRNTYGFWSEKYRLYKRSKAILENREKICLLVDKNEI